MVKYFTVPYEHYTHNGFPARRLILNGVASQQIASDGGYWEEAEIDGDQALVRIRATSTTLQRIASNLPVTLVTDPLSVWTPTRTKPINRGGEVAFDSGEVQQTKTINDLIDDVLTDAQSDRIKQIADQLIPRIEQQGYVKLVGYPWEFASKILSYFSTLGYGLDRISTGTFPTTSLLDNFNRADEGPPPSASWDYAAFGTSGVGVLSNMCGNSAGGGCNAYWKTQFGPDCEAYWTVGVVSLSDMFVLLRMKDVGTGGTGGTLADGYSISWNVSGGVTVIERIDNLSFTQLGAQDAFGTMTVGYKFGAEMIGSTIQSYWNSGSSWATAGTSRTDSTYALAGYIGAGHGSTVARFDDFSGGTVVTSAPGAFNTTRKIIWATRPS